MISARDLWYSEAQECSCGEFEDVQAADCTHSIIGGWATPFMRGSLRDGGRLIVSNNHVAVYVDELDITGMPTPSLLTIQQVRILATSLLARPLGRPSPRMFRGRYLDVIEGAGYQVRPLDVPGVTDPTTHGIVANGQVVGLVMPMAQDSISDRLGDRTAR